MYIYRRHFDLMIRLRLGVTIKSVVVVVSIVVVVVVDK